MGTVCLAEPFSVSIMYDLGVSAVPVIVLYL